MGDLATDARPAFDALHARALSLREAMAASSNPLSVLTGEVLDELHELASKAQDETMARLDAFQGAANHVEALDIGANVVEEEIELSPEEALTRAIGNEAIAQAEVLKAVANLSLAEAQVRFAESNAELARQDREFAEVRLQLSKGEVTKEELEEIMDQVLTGLEQNIGRLEV